MMGDFFQSVRSWLRLLDGQQCQHFVGSAFCQRFLWAAQEIEVHSSQALWPDLRRLASEPDTALSEMRTRCHFLDFDQMIQRI